MADYILLEDGVSRLMLEDGVSGFLTEVQAGSSPINGQFFAFFS